MPRIKGKTIKAHVELQQRQILEAAFALFLAKGYQGVSLAGIAADVGLARSSLYKYFPGKDEILIAAVMPRIESALADRQAAILGLPDPRERMAAWIRSTVMFCGDPEHRLVDLLAQIPLAQTELKQRMVQTLAPLIRQIRLDFAEVTNGSGLNAEMWVEIYDMSQRAAARYGRDRGRLKAVADELVMVAAALSMTRFSSDGRIIGHALGPMTVEYERAGGYFPSAAA